MAGRPSGSASVSAHCPHGHRCPQDFVPTLQHGSPTWAIAISQGLLEASHPRGFPPGTSLGTSHRFLPALCGLFQALRALALGVGRRCSGCRLCTRRSCPSGRPSRSSTGRPGPGPWLGAHVGELRRAKSQVGGSPGGPRLERHSELEPSRLGKGLAVQWTGKGLRSGLCEGWARREFCLSGQVSDT